MFPYYIWGLCNAIFSFFVGFIVSLPIWLDYQSLHVSSTARDVVGTCQMDIVKDVLLRFSPVLFISLVWSCYFFKISKYIFLSKKIRRASLLIFSVLCGLSFIVTSSFDAISYYKEHSLYFAETCQ